VIITTSPSLKKKIKKKRKERKKGKAKGRPPVPYASNT